MRLSPFRRRTGSAGYRVEYEHPAQIVGSAFLRAIAADEPGAVWERLSRETRGLLEGLYAARTAVPLRDAAALARLADGRLRDVVGPLRASVLAALGGSERVNAFGLSAARVVDRQSAYVLLLADFGEERIVSEADWRPSHLLALVHESREWLIDLARTAELSAEAQLPDPLGTVR